MWFIVLIWLVFSMISMLLYFYFMVYKIRRPVDSPTELRDVAKWIPLHVLWFIKLPKFDALITKYISHRNLTATPSALVQALKSEDRFVQLYGLKLLRGVCNRLQQERHFMYMLSQPGGHPRNWMALRDLTMDLVREVSDRLQVETRRRTIQTTFSKKNTSLDEKSLDGSQGALMNKSPNSPVVLNELYEGRQSFFIPPTLKPRSAEQFLPEIKRQHIRLPNFIEEFLDKVKHFFFVPSPIVSSYEALCTIFAIQALSAIIVHSLEEDHYGVVQKDLKTCLSSLARLSIDIDAYVRASGRTKSKGCYYDDLNVHILDGELTICLKAIREVFGQYLSELGIHPLEQDVFRVLV